MKTLTPIDPAALRERLRLRDVTLVDIREADEFAREHIGGAVSLPMSKITAASVALEPRGDIVFHCRTGMRTRSNCDRLAAAVDGSAFVLEGGLDAWKGAGLPVIADRKAPIEMMRQVQLAAGSLVVAGAFLAATIHPAFLWLSAVIGAGLMFAGASGWCGMAHVLALAPWNRRSA
jgi:rhodanese-related sulfurtransferase